MLKCGPESEFKKSRFNIELSFEVYKSAQSAFYVALLSDFEVSEIMRWQNEASAKAVQAETAPVQSASLEDRETAIWHMAEVEAEELAEANAKADLKAHSEIEAYEAELSGSEPAPAPVQSEAVTPEPEPEAAPVAEKPVQSEAAPVAEAVREPIKYWIGCYGGRNSLEYGPESEFKKSRSNIELSFEVYKSAQSACYANNLDDFEVSEITRWQNEASAEPVHTETAPVQSTPEPVRAAADKPIKTPKKSVSRKIAKPVQSETEKWMPAGIGKQMIYRGKF
jgi:hypothetical protein